jgi:hypothetical protein
LQCENTPFHKEGKNMKTVTPLKKMLPYLTIMAFAVFGIYIARLTFRPYEYLARGILGCTVLFLLYRLYTSPKNVEKPTGFIIEFPKDLNFIPFGFYWSIIIYWSSRLVIDMISWLINYLAK